MMTRRRALMQLGALPLAIGMPALVRAQGEQVYRIGALNPVTGQGSAYGTGMQKMILAMADQINAAGGVLGRKVEVYAEDSQSDPQAGVLAAKKLIEINKVQAILGTWVSGVSLAVAPMVNAADIFLMHTSGAPALSTPPVNEKGLVFRFQATNSRWGRAYAQVAAKEGYKRVATMSLNNAAGLSMVTSFQETWKAMGHDVVESVVYEPNQPSYQSELQKVLAAKPDAVVMGSYLSDTTILLREWYQSGEDVKWIAPSFAANSDLVKALGPEVVEGVMSVDSVSNENAESFKLYDAAYQKAMGKSGLTNNFAAMTWDMLAVLALAAEAAGTTDTQAVKQKLREVGNPPGTAVYTFEQGRQALKAGKINYEGASSVLDFDQYGDVTPDFGVFVIEKGEIHRKYVLKI